MGGNSRYLNPSSDIRQHRLQRGSNLSRTCSKFSIDPSAPDEATVHFPFGCNQSGLQMELANYRLQPMLGRLSISFVCFCVSLLNLPRRPKTWVPGQTVSLSAYLKVN